MKIIVFLLCLFSLTLYSCIRESDPRLNSLKHLSGFPEPNLYVGTYEPDPISVKDLKSWGVSDTIKHKLILTKDSLFFINLPDIFDFSVDLNSAEKEYYNTGCELDWGTMFNSVYHRMPQHSCFPEGFIYADRFELRVDDKNEMVIISYDLSRTENEVPKRIVYRKVLN